MRGKKMKHKIYLQFCLIAALAILVTTTIVTALFYQRFKAQVFSDVRTYAYVLTSVDTYDEATLIQEVHQLVTFVSRLSTKKARSFWIQCGYRRHGKPQQP